MNRRACRIASVAWYLIMLLRGVIAGVSVRASRRNTSAVRYALAWLSEHHDQLHSMIWARVIRGGLFMGWKAAAVGTGFGVQLGHMVDIGLGQAAAVIDFGKFCRQ